MTWFVRMLFVLLPLVALSSCQRTGSSVAVTVSPAEVVLAPGASQEFTVTVTGTRDTDVVWNATGGEVEGSGATIVYTAPANLGAFALTATSVADTGASADADIVLEVRQGMRADAETLIASQDGSVAVRAPAGSIAEDGELAVRGVSLAQPIPGLEALVAGVGIATSQNLEQLARVTFAVPDASLENGRTYQVYRRSSEDDSWRRVPSFSLDGRLGVATPTLSEFVLGVAPGESYERSASLEPAFDLATYAVHFPNDLATLRAVVGDDAIESFDLFTGICYGMSMTAGDYFTAGMPSPGVRDFRDSNVFGSWRNVPPEGLVRYASSRQNTQYLGFVARTFSNWSVDFARAYAVAGQAQKVLGTIQEGRPAPIGIGPKEGALSQINQGHVVLAYAGEERYDADADVLEFEFTVYDPNLYDGVDHRAGRHAHTPATITITAADYEHGKGVSGTASVTIRSTLNVPYADSIGTLFQMAPDYETETAELPWSNPEMQDLGVSVGDEHVTFSPAWFHATPEARSARLAWNVDTAAGVDHIFEYSQPGPGTHDIPLSRLPAGAYAVRAMIQDKQGNWSSAADATFTVSASEPDPVLETLTIERGGAGSGTVVSGPPGIRCGISCSAAFRQGEVVDLSADPAPGSMFAGWSGDPDCANGTLTMAAARTCEVTFDLASEGPNLRLRDARLTPRSPQVGDEIEFCVTWENSGDRAIDPASGDGIGVAAMYLDDDRVSAARFSNQLCFATVDPGTSMEVCADPFADVESNDTAGAHTIYVYADLNGEVPESSETDNRLVHTFSVADPQPTAKLRASPTSGEAPLDVTLDACDSTDHDVLDTFEFDTGDGEGTTTTSCSWSYRYRKAGTYTATVTVYDTADQTDTTDGSAIVITPPPTTRPNLILENAYLVPANPKEGESVDVCVTWRNADDGTAVLPVDGNIVVSRAFRNDEGVSGARFSNSLWYADIPAGGSREERVDAFRGDPATPGSHTVYAYTDADQEIDESNENDNRVVFTFDVEAAPTNAAPRITDLWAEQKGDLYACGSMIPDHDTTAFRWTASDPDGDTLAYDWRMDGEPWTRQSATDENELISDYDDHTFDVRAVDPSGATSQVRSCTVNASDPPEIFGVDGPGINETATVGSPTTFVVDVRDPDDHYPSEAVLYLYDPYQRIEMTRYLDSGADTSVTYVASVTFSSAGVRRYAMTVVDALGVAADSTRFIDFTAYP